MCRDLFLNSYGLYNNCAIIASHCKNLLLIFNNVDVGILNAEI